MILTQSTTLEAGVHQISEEILIAEDNLTLDGNGALIVGAFRSGPDRTPAGVGIRLRGRKNVTIKNVRLSNVFHGIHARDCQGLTITGCRVRQTGELAPNTVFLDIFRPPEQAYGGGILLWNVQDSRITRNDLQHQMNGLLTYHCRSLKVQKNLASYNSGFGFYLSGTSDSLFEDNHADFCCRWEPRGDRSGHMGADAAGFLIVHRSNHNKFQGNFARQGGDGFFLAGMTHDGQLAPCNHNLFEGNDASWSPNIAFEATFSSGNIFRDNFADFCNYGFWLGFSRQNVIEGNRIRANRQAGIAVENGVEMQVKGNDFRDNRYAMLLWSKFIPKFAAALPENDTSRDWQIEGNTFAGNATAIRIAADQDHGLRPYAPHGACPRPHHHFIQGNRFENNAVRVELKGADAAVEQESN